jgi:2-dehydro-3-deoxygluconokinase
MSKAAPKEQKTLIFGEPLVQFSQTEGQDPKYVGTAGDSYNLALNLLAQGARNIYFGTAFGGTSQTPHELDAVFINQLKASGANADTFTRYDSARHVGSYTIHFDKQGSQKDGKHNTYDRGNAAARFYFTPEYVEALKKKVKDEGITRVVGTHIMLGNCEDRDAQLGFFEWAKNEGIEVVWADNFRKPVWEGKDDKEKAAKAAEFSARAMKNATLTVASFDNEQDMFGDKTPEETAKRILGYGVKEAVITDGGNDITVATRGDNNEITFKKITPTPNKDGEKLYTAGAGDAFTSGYLWAKDQGYTPEQAARHGDKVAQIVLRKEKDNLDINEIPKPIEFPAHTASVSIRYFYRPDANGDLDLSTQANRDQERILGNIKAAKGISGITTSLHTVKREEPFTAWKIVKMLRHIEYDVPEGKDKIADFPTTEEGALNYLKWLKDEKNATPTGVVVMNFEDSRTSDNVKYGLDGRDKDIAVECENLRVLSKCGLNSLDRPGFCYTTNFMTPFDWFRTHMDFELPDKSGAMAIQTELLAMFDRYVVNIEPENSGYYKSQYGDEVMAAAEKLWKEKFKETDLRFNNARAQKDFSEATQAFVTSMLKGHAGSSETTKTQLEKFREQVKDARYLGQPKETACFENDPDGKIAHDAALKNLAYYGAGLKKAQEENHVRHVLHPDDPARGENNSHVRGSLGVFRVASTAQDIADMFNAGIGKNACTGCYGASPSIECEADVIRNAVALIKEKNPQANLSDLMPFMHLRKVIRGDEPLDHYNPNPDIQAFLKKTKETLGTHPESIAELPHHVSLTPLFKALEVMDENHMLRDIRPDHTTSIGFSLNYKTGQIEDGQLGQPGYDATRIMSGQMIRIMLDALRNLEKQNAEEFVVQFENKLCSFGLDSKQSYVERMQYLKDLDFGRALSDMMHEKSFKPVFKDPEIAEQVAKGASSMSVKTLTEPQRVSALRSA